MKVSVRAGALIAGFAMAMSVAVPLAMPAGAATPSVSCKAQTSPPLAAGKVVSTLSKCSPAALAAGGTSTTKAKAGSTSGQVVSTTVWKGGKGSTTSTISYTSKGVTKGKCKAPFDTRVKITGKVTKAAGAAAKITKAGEPVTAFICAITKGAKVGQTILEPGSLFKL